MSHAPCAGVDFGSFISNPNCPWPTLLPPIPGSFDALREGEGGRAVRSHPCASRAAADHHREAMSSARWNLIVRRM